MLPPEIESYLQQLLKGIADGDEVMGRTAVLGLAGRGGGLTPTGDDVLMGVLYGLWVWHPRQEWMEMIVAPAVPRTQPSLPPSSMSPPLVRRPFIGMIW